MKCSVLLRKVLSMVTKLKNSIFYHIPKTGGSWINEGIRVAFKEKEFVGPAGLAHASPEQYKPQAFFSWTVIRHPIAWLKSNFSYRTLQNDWGIFGDYAHNDFNEFARRLYEYNPRFVTKFFEPFLTVRYIALNETMQQDLENIFYTCKEELDMDAFFNRERVNTSLSDQVAMSEETKELILDQERWLLENYYEEKYEI